MVIRKAIRKGSERFDSWNHSRKGHISLHNPGEFGLQFSYALLKPFL
jgi:hypothetical protein